MAAVDPGSTPGMSKAGSRAAPLADAAALEGCQERLTAEGRRSLLVVLQGMDTSGKDGTIKHVIGAMNPQGCRVAAFKAPTAQERAHGFLWRIRRQLPGPGVVGVFNRSHYEDVVVVRVHHLVPEAEWRRRYGLINRFERTLAASGTTLVKIFLHISFEEQRRRLMDRLEDPTKRWKFNPDDLKERAFWGDYQAAYSEAIARCSTEAAPWYVVPADHKWYRNWAVGRLLVETFEAMGPDYPKARYDVRAMKAKLARS